MDMKWLNATTLAVSGRLDTNTAPDLDAAIKEKIASTTSLVLDISGLEYCSSAGLRVILGAHKSLDSAQGKLIVFGANETVMQVFQVTGLDSVLNLK